jgi:hypothetical protein
MIGQALSLNPQVLVLTAGYPQETLLTLTIALLGGASLLIGESVVLFLNRITPVRLVLSLVLNAVIFVAGLAIWAAALWVVGGMLFGNPPRLMVMVRLVCLSSAPFVFGFLILIPYFGAVIARILYVWTFLIMLSAVRFSFGIGLAEALLLVGAGWLLLLGFNATIGRPILAVQEWAWRKIAGQKRFQSPRELLTHFAETGQEETSRNKR